MLDLLDSLDALCMPRDPQPAGRTAAPCAAVATVISASGSVPRPAGTSMLVSVTGEVTGSLSGGCVEGAVYEACREAMATGNASRAEFGYSDEDAFAVGLSCGGTLEVLIQPLYPDALEMLAPAEAGTPAALIRRLDGDAFRAVLVPDPEHFMARMFHTELLGLLDSETALIGASAQLEPLVRGGRSGLLRLAPDGPECADAPITLFVETRLPAPRLFLFGANDFSAALLPVAKVLGYHVTLCDARPAFARQGRFRAAEEVLIEWPHRYLARAVEEGRVDRRSVICVLTHDAKFDIPLLHLALQLDVAYVGAMGSRRSHDQRMAGLRAAGVGPERLAGLHSPIGLDFGAVTPGEVAVSIAAEILACRQPGRTGRSLNILNGPLHGPVPSPRVRRRLDEGVRSWT